MVRRKSSADAGRKVQIRDDEVMGLVEVFITNKNDTTTCIVHIRLKVPVLVRSPKQSSLERNLYWVG